MKYSTIFTALALLMASVARGNGVGNGGDPLRELFEEARKTASSQVQDLDWCSFSPGTPQQTIDWILGHQFALVDDLMSTPHLWVVDGQPTCGFTQPSAKSPIYLSYPTCASTVGTSLKNAVFLVLHETAHHFGIRNEQEADAIARAMQSADATMKCPASPANVFDARVCSGPRFTNADTLQALGGKSRAAIGGYRVFGRYRTCIASGTCKEWREAALEVANPQNNRIPLMGSGTIILEPVGNSQGFGFRFQHDLSPLFRVSSLPIFGNPDRIELKLSSWDAAYALQNLPLSAATSYVGFLNRNCGWFSASITIPPDAFGRYMEGQTVIYGTH